MRSKKSLHIRLFTCILLLAPFYLASGPSPARAVAANHPGALAAEPSQPWSADFVPGELLVGFYEDALLSNAAAIDGTLAQLRVQSSAEMQTCAASGRVAAAADAGTTVAARRLTVPPGREGAIRAELETLDAVAFATPNWIARAATPLSRTGPHRQSDSVNFINDPLYTNEQWYLQNIRAEAAWSVAFGEETGSSPLETVRVAVVDSGINFEHPEFGGRILPGQNYVNPGATAEDDYGHGSHVAGLLGALINNSTGIAGVAREIVLDPRKALDQNGEGAISDVVEAICDATDDGADIINLSLAAPNAPLLQNAVEYADEQGVLLIAAAGNLGNIAEIQWPAAYPEVVAVAATTIGNTRASYSNQGASLEIAAPGGDIVTPMLSTWRQRQNDEPNALLCPSYLNDDNTPETYCYNLGTSMAAALVSGAAALVWSVDPLLTADEVRLAIRNTAMPLDAPATAVGQGLLDVEKAVRTVATSNLLLVESPAEMNFMEGAGPYTATITFENPSLEPLDWVATVSPASWLSPTTPLSGTVRYNEPGSVQFQVLPANLTPGSYGVPVTITGTRADETQVALIVNLNFTVEGPDHAPPATLTVTGSGPAPVLQPGAAPYVETFTLENASPAPLMWEAVLPPFEWLTPTTPLTGTVTFSASAAFSVTVDPSDLAPGRYGASITVLGTREDASQLARTARIDFTIASGTSEPPLFFTATATDSEFELPPASRPFTTSIALENSGTETVTWQAQLPAVPWVTTTNAPTGTLPADTATQFVAEFDPRALTPGTYTIDFTFIGSSVESSIATQIVPFQLTVRTVNVHSYLPVIRREVDR